MNKIDSMNNKIYILGDFNINLYLNDSYFLDKNNILSSKSIPSDIKNYHEFCTFFRLKLRVATRIASGSSTIIDHILARYPERVTQCGVIDIGLSDHQLIFCTGSSLVQITSGKQVGTHNWKHPNSDIKFATSRNNW